MVNWIEDGKVGIFIQCYFILELHAYSIQAVADLAQVRRGRGAAHSRVPIGIKMAPPGA